MGTFYLGLSMAGTVSAGTYTGGTLTEINNWLVAWQKARKEGVVLKAVKAVGNYNVGDEIRIEPHEIPSHFVKIKSMAGASGGGVSAALYMAGLSTGTTNSLLKDIWTSFDVKDMLDINDISNGKSVYSLLNVKPLDDKMEVLRNLAWTDHDFAKDLEYLDDNVEIFLTLSSFEGIPYKSSPARGNGVSYGVLKSHFDYIKFNYSKNGNEAPSRPNIPYAHSLVYRKNHVLSNDANWSQLIAACPATAAFPIGFKSRSLKRFRNEYEGKLFYLNYSYANPSFNFDYSKMKPAWPEMGGLNNPFEMEYMDGGACNREPHDLARASIIESLNLPNKRIESNGIDTNACVILIDPFPSNFDAQSEPGSVVDAIPTLLQQPQYIISTLMNQSRFRPDWLERALDDKYYSRFLISPLRRDAAGNVQELPLAAGLLGAFSGFINRSFREHDYALGRYNTYQFLNKNFMIPSRNVEIDYYRNADETLKAKYESLGWYDAAKDECQIIPRMEEPTLLNSLQQPVWPTINQDVWEEVKVLAIKRAKELANTATNFKYVDGIADGVIWNVLLKDKVNDILDVVEKDLVKHQLIRKRKS